MTAPPVEWDALSHEATMLLDRDGTWQDNTTLLAEALTDAVARIESLEDAVRELQEKLL